MIARFARRSKTRCLRPRPARVVGARGTWSGRSLAATAGGVASPLSCGRRRPCWGRYLIAAATCAMLCGPTGPQWGACRGLFRGCGGVFGRRRARPGYGNCECPAPSGGDQVQLTRTKWRYLILGGAALWAGLAASPVWSGASAERSLLRLASQDAGPDQELSERESVPAPAGPSATAAVSASPPADTAARTSRRLRDRRHRRRRSQQERRSTWGGMSSGR
jgi:hypothetical protein